MAQEVDLNFGIGSECQDNIMPTSVFARTWCPYKHPNMKGMNNMNHVKPRWGSVESSPLALAQLNAKKSAKNGSKRGFKHFYVLGRTLSGQFEDGLLANESSNECGALMPWSPKGSEPQSVSWSLILKLLGPRNLATHPDSEVL